MEEGEGGPEKQQPLHEQSLGGSSSNNSNASSSRSSSSTTATTPQQQLMAMSNRHSSMPLPSTPTRRPRLSSQRSSNNNSKAPIQRRQDQVSQLLVSFFHLLGILQLAACWVLQNVGNSVPPPHAWRGDLATLFPLGLGSFLISSFKVFVPYRLPISSGVI